jgi:hypothetical protein
MTGSTALGKALCVAAMTFALASAAHAGALRTFVSSLGNDSNTSSNCAVTTPCRTLQAAFGVTTVPGGEIDAQDAAGYGTISGSITGTLSILGVPGAAISVPGGGIGLGINAPGGIVVIDSFQINGNAAGTNAGINLAAGNLVLRNSVLKLLDVGMIVGSGTATAHADLDSTDVIGNTIGIKTDGAGVPYNTGVGEYLASGCPCATLVRINVGNYVDNTTVFSEENPTAVAGEPTATIWAENYFPTGYTTLITSTGTGGAGAGNPPVQNSSPFPN